MRNDYKKNLKRLIHANEIKPVVRFFKDSFRTDRLQDYLEEHQWTDYYSAIDELTNDLREQSQIVQFHDGPDTLNTQVTHRLTTVIDRWGQDKASFLDVGNDGLEYARPLSESQILGMFDDLKRQSQSLSKLKKRVKDLWKSDEQEEALHITENYLHRINPNLNSTDDAYDIYGYDISPDVITILETRLAEDVDQVNGINQGPDVDMFLESVQLDHDALSHVNQQKAYIYDNKGRGDLETDEPFPVSLSDFIGMIDYFVYEYEPHNTIEP